MILNKIVASILALFTFLFAFLGIYRVKDTNAFDNKDWMKNISGEKYLSEISIPGTHDTCALYEPIYNVAKDQTYSVKDQLDMGVRFLDIRGRIHGEKIQMTHDFVNQFDYFDGVLDTIYAFLDENPSETVIMSLKLDYQSNNENTLIFTELVKKYISSNAQKWFTDNAVAKLKDVRGKIVLLNRFDQASKLGIRARRWSDNTIFSIDNTSFNINIQDYYSFDDVNEKWDKAKAAFENAKLCDKRDANLYINFLSGCFKPIPQQRTVAKTINANYLDYISENPKGCYGIVLFDFVEKEYCERLINSNF